MKQQSGETPLFPLNTVLFPGTQLPLHIFEQRYRQMINWCIAERSSFGVVLIKEGAEVGGPVVSFEVGTTARILKVDRLQDGRMNVLIVGDRRFKILEKTQCTPYLKGNLAEFNDSDQDCRENLIELVRVAFRGYMRTLLGLRGNWVREIDVETHPVALSYLVASTLDIDMSEKQRLLQTDNVEERLEHELLILEKEQKRLWENLENNNPFTGVGLN